MIVAFLGMEILPFSLWSLAVGAVVFDLGVMAALVSHQTIVNGLDPQARSRLNGLLMTGAMVGVATGAAIGSAAWASAGTLGLYGFAAAAGMAALAVSFLNPPLENTPMTRTVEERLFRAPYLQPRPGSDRPLTVLCSLLSRADNTPLTERRRAEGHMLDHAENVIADPAAEPSANAFEGNPNLNFEHWGEYWRKVHGVRFIHAEEADDRTLERLLRYDQLHRFAPGPTATDAPPYRAPADEQGRLWLTVVGHVEPYRRPRWDGIAYLNFASLEDVAVVLGNERVREKILPEDQAIFRDIAPVLSRQYVIVPSDTGNEAITLVKLHVRNPTLSRDAFQQWWLRDHAPLATAQSKDWARRYVQLHNIGPTGPGQPLYHPQGSTIDGVTLMNFVSVNDLEDFLRSPEYKAIAGDEARMTDATAGEWWTTIGMVLVNRIAPERATDLGA
ncbi:hypothetical protein J2793_006973 [Paraburkholderia caledonica]|uniref:EthD domain-containing protein n=1 Tax=Paraburkholderia caledonica TaxID=134536 RepID=A0AB73INC4_9BURK|nr:hypothetical protein [Paraburkholderia caledonica]